MADMAGPRSLRQLLDAVLTVGSDLDLPAMLHRIVRSVVDLVDARYGALGVLDETGMRLSQFITVGMDQEEHHLIGHLPEGHGILGLLIHDAKPIRLPDLSEHPDSYGFPPGHPPMRSFLGVPIRLRDQVFGNLYLTNKQSGEVFTDVDEEMAVGLAAAASVAIENARLHALVHELALVEDRERIARDLHDTVIQRLFATGLSLQGSLRLVRPDPDAASARIENAVDELDLTVKHIRTAIFGLDPPRPPGQGLRTRLLALVQETTASLGFEPRVLFEGPIDATVTPATAQELLAVVREALSNVARHAEASQVQLELTAGTDVTVVVADDGAGPPTAGTAHGNGLLNMATRATRLGGTMQFEPAAGGGSRLTWQVPNR
jgi:signal transduction histidine kinase